MGQITEVGKSFMVETLFKDYLSMTDNTVLLISYPYSLTLP